MKLYQILNVLLLSTLVIAKNYDFIVTPAEYVLSEKSDNNWFCDIKDSSSNFNFLSEKFVADQLIKTAVLREFYTRKVFGITYAKMQELLSSGYKDIVDKLLAHTQWSDKQIMFVWQMYKNKRKWNVFSEKDDCEKSLIEKLNHRKKAKEKKLCLEQEQRKYIDFEQGLGYQSSQYYFERKQALIQTKEQSYQKYTQSHNLDAQTVGFLTAHHVDHAMLQNISGTTLQHELVDEVIGTYKKAAKAVFEYGLQGSYLIPETIYAANVSLDINVHDDDVVVAAYISDLADSMAEVTLSIGRAVKRSVAGAVDIIMHPGQIPELVTSLMLPIVKIVNFCGNFLIINDGMTETLEEFQRSCELRRQECEQFKQIGALCVNHIQNSSGQELVEETTKVIVDGIVCGKALHLLSRLFKGIKNLDTITALENIASESGAMELLEDFSHVQGEYKPISSIGELETELASLMEAETIAAKYGACFPIVTDFERFTAILREFNGVIPWSHKVLVDKMKPFLAMLQQQLKHPLTEEWCRLYANKRINNIDVIARLDHICNFEFQFVKCGTANGYVLKASGGHFSGMCEALEQTRLFKIVDKIEYQNGVIDYIMENALTKQTMTKTVLPKTWTMEKTVDAVWDVYETGIHKPSKNLQCRYKYKKIGDVDVSLLIKLEKNLQQPLKSKDHIVTLLPYEVGT